MTLRTTKIVNFSFLIIVIGFIVGKLILIDFKIAELSTINTIGICTLLIVAIVKILSVRKQEKLASSDKIKNGTNNTNE